MADPIGYRATRTDKEFVVHDVEIFCECEREDFKADAKWIKAAFKKLQAEAREDNYFPPLHIRHHERGAEVRAAGTFEPKEVRSIKLGGKQVAAIVVDYHVTDEQTAQDIMDGKLPYRSVEIFDVDAEPSIDGLALLDHEAPYLRLPMLRIGAVQRVAELRPMAASAAPVAALFRKGHCINPLEREEQEMGKKGEAETFGAGVIDEDANAVTTEAKPGQFMEDGPPKPPPADADDDDEGESKTPAKLDAASVIAAINDGTIPIGDYDSICEAIDARKAAAAGQQPQQPGQPQQPPQRQVAPIAPPGAAAMKAEPKEAAQPAAMTAQDAAREGEILALKARLDERDASDKRREDVAAALKRLDGIPAGADLEERLVAFHTRANGDPELFKAFVDSIAQHTPPARTGKQVSFDFGGRVPDVAMKYMDEGGTEAVDMAARFAREWEQLKDRGLTVSLENYVAGHMKRQAAKREEMIHG